MRGLTGERGRVDWARQRRMRKSSRARLLLRERESESAALS